MPYPLPKLDMVSVPEFSAGAMENFGLIIYRENLLLQNDLLSTAEKKQDVSHNYKSVPKSTAHQSVLCPLYSSSQPVVLIQKF